MWPKIASRVVWTDSGPRSPRNSEPALRPWLWTCGIPIWPRCESICRKPRKRSCSINFILPNIWEKPWIESAAGSIKPSRPKATSVCRTTPQRVENGARLGAEGDCNGSIRLCVREASPQAFSVVVQLGGTESLAAHQRSGQHVEASIRKHHHLFTASDYQRCQRIAQCQDPVGEIHCSRIPEQTEFHARDLLSLRWSGFSTVIH